MGNSIGSKSLFLAVALFYFAGSACIFFLTNNAELTISYIGIAVAFLAVFISMDFAEDVIKLNDGLKNKLDKMDKKLDELLGKSKKK